MSIVGKERVFMKIKGTIGQYPIDLEIEDNIDYSKINKLISRISEDYKNKQQWEANKVVASTYKSQETSLCSPANIMRGNSWVPPLFRGLSK